MTCHYHYYSLLFPSSPHTPHMWTLDTHQHSSSISNQAPFIVAGNMITQPVETFPSHSEACWPSCKFGNIQRREDELMNITNLSNVVYKCELTHSPSQDVITHSYTHHVMLHTFLICYKTPSWCTILQILHTLDNVPYLYHWMLSHSPTGKMPPHMWVLMLLPPPGVELDCGWSINQTLL